MAFKIVKPEQRISTWYAVDEKRNAKFEALGGAGNVHIEKFRLHIDEMVFTINAALKTEYEGDSLRIAHWTVDWFRIRKQYAHRLGEIKEVLEDAFESYGLFWRNNPRNIGCTTTLKIENTRFFGE